MSTVARPLRWVAAVLLALYAIVVARLTLEPAASESGIFALLNRLMSRASGGRLDWSQTEVLANIALFIPAAFLLAVALGRAWTAAALCIVASAAIELAQLRYLPSRVPSVADVVHNGLGAVIGAGIAWLLFAELTTDRRLPQRGQYHHRI